MTKTVRARYTLEFKQEAVRLVTGGQSIAAAARSLGLVEQTLFNWVKADLPLRMVRANTGAKEASMLAQGIHMASTESGCCRSIMSSKRARKKSSVAIGCRLQNSQELVPIGIESPGSR